VIPARRRLRAASSTASAAVFRDRIAICRREAEA